jgi:hypothetical protein
MAITRYQEKYLNRNRKKKGSMPASIRKLTKEIQFFLVLKILIREKASLHSCLEVGITRAPVSSFHPYEGVKRSSSIKAIRG